MRQFPTRFHYIIIIHIYKRLRLHNRGHACILYYYISWHELVFYKLTYICSVLVRVYYMLWSRRFRERLRVIIFLQPLSRCIVYSVVSIYEILLVLGAYENTFGGRIPTTIIIITNCAALVSGTPRAIQ